MNFVVEIGIIMCKIRVEYARYFWLGDSNRNIVVNRTLFNAL